LVWNPIKRKGKWIMESNRLAFAVEISQNAKVGLSSGTYASQVSTCPDSCPLKPTLDDKGKVVKTNGCYANGTMVAMQSAKLNQAPKQSAREAQKQEVKAIEGLSGSLDLRVHVVGDCVDDTHAKALSKAMSAHRKKKGKAAWTYTHNWRKIKSSSWQGESVLASCDSLSQVKEAKKLGYSSAVILDSFDSPKVYVKDGIKLLPCLYQTKGIQCIDCRLCLDSNRLARLGLTIAFVPHGGGKAKARLALGMVS
jgi:hypothetical protein